MRGRPFGSIGKRLRGSARAGSLDRARRPRPRLHVAIASGAAALASLALAPASAGAAILVDQTPQGTFSVPTVPSFDSSPDTVDNQAADDFTVPEGQVWTPQGIDVFGLAQSGSGTDTGNVTIFGDVGGIPGAPQFTQSGIPLTNGTCNAPNNCNPSAGLANAPGLVPGTYWISFQTSGPVRWWWATMPPGTPEGSAAVWQNPGNASGKNCLTFTPVLDCGWINADDGRDLIFRLNGVLVDSRFDLGEISSRGLRLSLSAVFPAAGSAVVAGKGVKKRTSSVDAGPEKLPVKLKKGVKRKIKRGKKAKISVKVTFTADGGVPFTQKLNVKLIPGRTLSGAPALRVGG